MQSEQKKIDTLLRDLISLSKQVGQAVDQAKSFRVKCKAMGKQVCQLSQMLATLLGFITFHPILLHLDPIHCVISQVSRILQEALALACKCKSKTIFCPLFTGTKPTSFPKLYNLLNVCISDMNWLLLIYNPSFDIAFNEMFLLLPLACSCMVTENTFWELAIMLRRETSLNFRVLKNSRMIKEIIDLLMFCLAKLVEAEHGDLQCCFMTIITEIAAAAESNLDLRCKAFKTNSPGSNAIVEQLLRVTEESQDPTLQVPAIKSIGCLARIFYERENHHVIGVLVSQLDNGDQEVATEAAIALQKFACEDNYFHKEHSKKMVEFNAVQPLVRLLRDGGSRQQLHGLLLMCYIAINADYSEAMEQARFRTAFEELLATNRGFLSVVSQNPELNELIPKALQYLTLYYEY
ncbi:hypothetical protein DITRI_Ditri01bG0013400 [Diplodiscus trichospermus]